MIRTVRLTVDLVVVMARTKNMKIRFVMLLRKHVKVMKPTPMVSSTSLTVTSRTTMPPWPTKTLVMST